jgi:hypothetical protein
MEEMKSGIYAPTIGQHFDELRQHSFQVTLKQSMTTLLVSTSSSGEHSPERTFRFTTTMKVAISPVQAMANSCHCFTTATGDISA